jgi:hypothetical protein
VNLAEWFGPETAERIRAQQSDYVKSLLARNF